MPFAIQTKILPATRTKGARVKADWNSISITIPYSYRFNTRENLILAAITLRKKYAPLLRFSGWGYLSNMNMIITTK